MADKNELYELEKHAKMMEDFGVCFEVEEYMTSEGLFIMDGMGRYIKMGTVLNMLCGIDTIKLEKERQAIIDALKDD